VKLKKFKKTWKKHRHFVITGGQIITILGIIAGIFTTYWQVHQNTSDIKNVNQWVGHNLGDKTENITQLKTDFTNLQSKVELQLMQNQKRTREFFFPRINYGIHHWTLLGFSNPPSPITHGTFGIERRGDWKFLL